MEKYITVMDIQEIRHWHNVFKHDSELFEIRVLSDKTWSGYFYDVEKAIEQLKPFDNANIYYSVNEVKSACASREQFNRFKQVRGTATSEQDIEHRWWLPIDIDCERPSGVSSTDEEKESAHKKAQSIFLFLRENGFVEPIICDSSSGYHIFIPIDMPNTQEAKAAIKLFLDTLSNRFSDEKVKIDVVLHDANRIIRLPGSYGRKGRSTDERPHRMAKILYAPKVERRMTQSEIDSFNEKYKITIQQPIQRYNSNNQEKFDLRNFIQENHIEITKEIPLNGGGTKYILKECPFDSSHISHDSALFEIPNGAISFKCFHYSHSHIGWREFRLHFDPHAYDYEDQPQRQYRQIAPQVPLKPKYEVKEEKPELGKKWYSMSDIRPLNLLNLENVKTGIDELDRKIVGLHMSEVTLLSGSNSSGKSSWLNTLLLNIIDQDDNVALWSGELRADILKTWIQFVAAGDNKLMESQRYPGKYEFVPGFDPGVIDRWMDGKFFLYNNEYGTKWEQIFSDMEALLKRNVKVFILDNLFTLDINLFEGDKNNKQKELILQIKDFAKKNSVHIILVAHPRKAMGFLRKNDISGTADLTNAVDNVFIIHRNNKDFENNIDDFYGPHTYGRYESYGNILEVVKNRMYGVVDLLVGMHYEISTRRFKNTETEYRHYGWETGTGNAVRLLGGAAHDHADH